MQFIKKVINGLNVPFLKISIVLIFLMMFVTVADVVGRYFFNHPILGVFELTRFSLGAIVCTALGFSQINKVHIAINIFVSHLSLDWRNIIETINCLLAFLTFAIVSWQMFVYAWRLYDASQVTSVLGAPIYPFVFVSALGVVLFTIVLFHDLARATNRLFSRRVEDEYRIHWDS